MRFPLAELFSSKLAETLANRVRAAYAEAQPQFWAQFSDWNLSPGVSDAQFTFTPPEGAAKIALAARKSVPTAQGERNRKKGARP